MNCYLNLGNAKFMQLPSGTETSKPEGMEIQGKEPLLQQARDICEEAKRQAKEADLLQVLYTYTPKNIREHLLLQSRHNALKDATAVLDKEKETVRQTIVANMMLTGTILQDDSGDYLFVLEDKGMRVAQRMDTATFLLERHRKIIDDEEYLFESQGIRYKIVACLECFEGYSKELSCLPAYVICKETYENITEELKEIQDTIRVGANFEAQVDQFEYLTKEAAVLKQELETYEAVLTAFIRKMLDYNKYPLEEKVEFDFCE